MNTKLIRGLFVAIALFIAALPCDVRASWADVPIEEVVKQKPVVVVGEIKRIKAVTEKDNESIAFIKVERVLKNTSGQNVEAGTELPLSMPSALRMSTDIQYKQGQRGVWILKFENGAYKATYPKDFQQASEEAKIAEIIKKQSSK